MIELAIAALLAGWTVWYVLRPLFRPGAAEPPRDDP